MLWGLKQDLKQLSRQADPRPEFQRALRKEFAVSRPWYISVVRPFVAGASIVMMLGAGTAAYAYNSDDVLPDHPLYPIREQVERVEDVIAFTPTQRANIQLRHVQRRIRELELMTARQKAIRPAQVDVMTQGLERAESAGRPLQDGARKRFEDALIDVEARRTRLFNGLNATTTQEVRPILRRVAPTTTRPRILLQQKRAP